MFNAKKAGLGLFAEDHGQYKTAHEYDAWGNIIDTEYMTIRDKLAGNNNIYRYRGKYGYVYEKDLDLYYLQTRFYDPKIGRFLNEDDPDNLCATGTALGGNLYAYCENDITSSIDYQGKYKVENKSSSYNRLMYNCYAYAFGIYDKWLIIGKGINSKYDTFGGIKPGFNTPIYYTIEGLKLWVKSDFGSKVRVISGLTSELKNGEYMIAARIRVEIGLLSVWSFKIPVVIVRDFHFWKQDPNTGAWVNKHDDLPVHRLGYANPNSNYSSGWIFYRYRINGMVFSEYYNSITAFFAYKGTFSY